MGYLSDVLKYTDNQNIIFVGTGVIVLANNKILMGKRVDNGEWCIPGGSLELNETLEECAVRELLEETSIVANADDLKLNTVKFLKDPINKNGRDIYIVSVSYILENFDDTNLSLDSREFSKYGWFNRDEIFKIFDKITPYTREGLKEYFKNIDNQGIN